MRVKIDNSIPTSLDPECAHCAQTLSRSGIMDLLISVNRQMLDSFNLKTLVSCNIFNLRFTVCVRVRVRVCVCVCARVRVCVCVCV